MAIFMTGKIRRALSIIIIVFIIATSLPLTVTAAPSFNQIVNASEYIITSNEGTYTTVLRNDNGALSIGKLCWHATNALNLLKEIIAANPSQALSILGVALYNEVITSSYWESRILTQAEASVIAVLLSTSESMTVQDTVAYTYISGYIQHGMRLGITEPVSLVFFADFENQSGYAGASNFYSEVMSTYGRVTLATLYECSSKNARRTKTYNFCATINWDSFSDSHGSQQKDTTPPTISDVTVSNLTENGYTVSCSAADNKSVAAVYYAVYYRTDGIDGTKWYKYTPSDGKSSHTVNISEFSGRSGDYCTFIYAFDEAGNYSYVGLNIITVPESVPAVVPFTLTVSAIKDGSTDRKITWRAKATGGSGNYQYAFALYRNGNRIDMRNFNDFSDYSYTAEENGVYHVIVAAYDAQLGKTASVTSTDINIFDPIVIYSVTANKPAAMLGETVTWTANASGGEGELKYSYTLYKDDTAVYSTAFLSNKSFSYKPESGGVYSVSVNVMDQYSQTASLQSGSITVIEPLAASDVAFSKSYTIAGASVSCSAEISGGSGSYTCVFTIYCDNEPVLTSEPVSASDFTFTVPKSGSYTAKVTVTDADGTVTSVTGGSMTAAKEAQKGDANCDGKVNASDARLVLRCAAKLETIDESFRHLADVNGDGRITASDARLILRAAAQLETL